MIRLRDRKITNVAREIIKRPDLIQFLNSNQPLEDIFLLPSNLSCARVQRYRDAYLGVGNTQYCEVPLENNNRLFIKMECSNEMGNNHYSRFWLVFLFITEALGIIDPDQTRIIEVTSGSSGISLAWVSEELGFDVTILVPSMLPKQRIAPMERPTTTVYKVPGYIADCILHLRRLIAEENYYATNHSEEKANIITSVFSRIGHEIIADSIEPDIAILGMGNGTSTEAIGKVLKDYNSDLEIFSYRPHYEIYPDDIVFGLIGANINCRHISSAMKYVDELNYTTGIDIEYIRERFWDTPEIATLGPSSLYGVHFALELSKKVNNKNFVSIGYDRMDRY